MPVVTAYYQDLSTALDAIDKTRIQDPEKPTAKKWYLFRDNIAGAQDSSLTTSWGEDTESLLSYVRHCRKFDAPYLAERASSVATLSEQLQGNGLHAVSMKRKQVWTRSGSKINPHRVLRGQLSTAWRRTVREQRSSTMGRIALILPIAVSANIPNAQILWSSAATLTLAAIARQAGRSVDLYGVAYGYDTFQKYTHVVCIPLMLSHHVWSIHNTMLATSEACFRRLCFRLWEIDQVKYGPINLGYGFPGSSKQIKQWVQNEFAAKIGLPEQAIYIGCTQSDRISDMTSARNWLETTVAALDAA